MSPHAGPSETSNLSDTMPLCTFLPGGLPNKQALAPTCQLLEAKGNAADLPEDCRCRLLPNVSSPESFGSALCSEKIRYSISRASTAESAESELGISVASVSSKEGRDGQSRNGSVYKNEGLPGGQSCVPDPLVQTLVKDILGALGVSSHDEKDTNKADTIPNGDSDPEVVIGCKDLRRLITEGLRRQDDMDVNIAQLLQHLLKYVKLDFKDLDEPSIGALLHGQGVCKPCVFANKNSKVCHNGLSCYFCHHYHKERRRRSKTNKKDMDIPPPPPFCSQNKKPVRIPPPPMVPPPPPLPLPFHHLPPPQQLRSTFSSFSPRTSSRLNTYPYSPAIHQAPSFAPGSSQVNGEDIVRVILEDLSADVLLRLQAAIQLAVAVKKEEDMDGAGMDPYGSQYDSRFKDKHIHTNPSSFGQPASLHGCRRRSAATASPFICTASSPTDIPTQHHRIHSSLQPPCSFQPPPGLQCFAPGSGRPLTPYFPVQPTPPPCPVKSHQSLISKDYLAAGGPSSSHFPLLPSVLPSASPSTPAHLGVNHTPYPAYRPAEPYNSSTYQDPDTSLTSLLLSPSFMSFLSANSPASNMHRQPPSPAVKANLSYSTQSPARTPPMMSCSPQITYQPSSPPSLSRVSSYDLTRAGTQLSTPRHISQSRHCEWPLSSHDRSLQDTSGMLDSCLDCSSSDLCSMLSMCGISEDDIHKIFGAFALATPTASSVCETLPRTTDVSRSASLGDD